MMILKLDLLFFSVRTSDKTEPFFSIPTLQHTPLSAEKHSGSVIYHFSNQEMVTVLGDIPVPYPSHALSHLRQGTRLLLLRLL